MAINLHIKRKAVFRNCLMKGLVMQGLLMQGILMLALLIPFIIFPDASNLLGQRSPFDPARAHEASQIVEELEVYTDRSLYITDEPVRFTAHLRENGPIVRRPWSRVLYVELVSAEGLSMARGKYQVQEGKAWGEISIPSNLISGKYFLRSYSRWMRNRGPESYCYVPLSIVNPHRTEVQKEVLPSKTDADLREAQLPKSSLDFEPHTFSFKSGERVTMHLPLPGSENQEDIWGCLTVVSRQVRPASLPMELKMKNAPAQEGSTGELPGDSTGSFQVRFLPDKYGPSLSGYLAYPAGRGLSPSETRIHFTMMGDNPGYLVGRPDASGRFAVALPFLSGNLELFVQPENLDGVAVEVRIDQDFDQKQLSLPVPGFELSVRDREVATIMARNVQLSEIYKDTSPREEKDSAGNEFPFYGSPTLSVDMDNYVLLPTLEEVFLNLVPSVTPVTRRKRNSLRIDTENPTLALFAPLVMVDQVPVPDIDKFMSVSPAKIKRIDVIEDVYVKGNLRFGGLINLVSHDGDMAGIDLPDNSFFIDYQAIHPPVTINSDQVSGVEGMPDTRNTLLWLPDVSVGTGSPLTLSFTAPMYPGEYVVLFRGRDEGGEYIVAETTFEVKPPITP